jgi:NAD(P)-dependent dehydrogenase (short-subunit alcohol dehydrogenase family)
MPAYDIAKIAVVRLTTHAHLRDTANIRVNCLVPDWVTTPEVKKYYDALTPEQRHSLRIAPALTSFDEIAQTRSHLRFIIGWTCVGHALRLGQKKKPSCDLRSPRRRRNFTAKHRFF